MTLTSHLPSVDGGCFGRCAEFHDLMALITVTIQYFIHSLLLQTCSVAFEIFKSTSISILHAARVLDVQCSSAICNWLSYLYILLNKSDALKYMWIPHWGAGTGKASYSTTYIYGVHIRINLLFCTEKQVTSSLQTWWHIKSSFQIMDKNPIEIYQVSCSAQHFMAPNKFSQWNI